MLFINDFMLRKSKIFKRNSMRLCYDIYSVLVCKTKTLVKCGNRRKMISEA